MPHILSPLEPPYATEVEAALNQYPQQDGYLLSLFRTFANGLRFLKRGVPNLLDPGSPLSLRTRELVILRVTARRRCEYEWGVHVALFSKAAHLTPAEVEATCREGIDEAAWGACEGRLLRAVDSLLETGRLAHEALDHFREDWTLEEQLEVAALCGTYQTISFVANLAELATEPFAARFPDGVVAPPE